MFRAGHVRSTGRLLRSTTMATTLRVLCVHGIGHIEQDPKWIEAWKGCVNDSLRAVAPSDMILEPDGLSYDDFFARMPLSALEMAEGVARLAASGIWHG